MIDSFGIKKTEQLVRKSGTNNVLQIAGDLGIKLNYENYENLLGIYTCRWKHRFIINKNARN